MQYVGKKLERFTMAAMLNFFQVVIGHDWGSFIVGRFALWHPNRILALAM